jgi:glucose/arabinose dehydrogenase
MFRQLRLTMLALSAAVIAAGCESARLPHSAGVGVNPALPPPNPTRIPTVHFAPAKGWPTGVTPTAAPGTTVSAFATGLEHPRWLYILPNGDVLVAESAAPPQPEEYKGLKGVAMKVVMGRMGSRVPSANRITLLRDADGDGTPEVRSVFLEGLNSPFGMAVVGEHFYVANTDAVLRFPWVRGAIRITEPGTKIVDLPAGPLNRHWTRSLIANRDGSKLYVTVGSDSDHAETGIEREAGRAAIWEIDTNSHTHRVFASGLRNPTGLAWEPTRQALWTVVNERDSLGSDLVPDYLTSVEPGAFYGWPYSYFGQHVDPRVKPSRPDVVATAMRPDYALGAHVAPLGLAFSRRNALPPAFGHGMFVGQHGSYNRRPLSGYSVVFVPFHQGAPAGPPVEVLGGFVGVDGEAYGRPVGVAFDRQGALLVADDVGNVVWRVTAAGLITR